MNGIKHNSPYPVRLPLFPAGMLKLRAYRGEVVAVGRCDIWNDQDAVDQLNAHIALDDPFIWEERKKAAYKLHDTTPLLSKMKTMEPA